MAWLQIQAPAAMWNHLSVLIYHSCCLCSGRDLMQNFFRNDWVWFSSYLYTWTQQRCSVARTGSDSLLLAGSISIRLYWSTQRKCFWSSDFKLNTTQAEHSDEVSWQETHLEPEANIIFQCRNWSFKLIPEKKIHTPQATLSTATPLSEMNAIKGLNSLLGSRQNRSCSQSTHTVVGKTAKWVPK